MSSHSKSNSPSTANNISQSADEQLAVKVLRSQKRADTYLYLAMEDDYKDIPEALQKHFGEATEFLSFALHGDKKLAQVDAKKVMHALTDQGYYLQLPPSTQPVPQPQKDAQLDVTPTKHLADPLKASAEAGLTTKNSDQ